MPHPSEASRPAWPAAGPPLRILTAAALFDGHDVAINIMRRLLQSQGCEVIHLGHNRSVQEIVAAALEEDVHGIALSSYQGGHLESFKYLVDLLREHGAGHIKVFGGGGGVIVPDEIRALEAYGVTRIYSPEDGQRLGLEGMIADLMAHCAGELARYAPPALEAMVVPAAGADPHAVAAARRALAQWLTVLENDTPPGALTGAELNALRARLMAAAATIATPVVGITGTGGAGKSSLTDELVRRLRLDQDDRLRIAVLSVDPTRRKSGGALLGDRIRMNAIDTPQVFMRSLATRATEGELSAALPAAIAACKWAGFDLILVETAGIGQADAGIVDQADVLLYVMTPEFGAATQLEKIAMLDFADLVAINKFDRAGAHDALRDVAKQMQRNQARWQEPWSAMPVFGTQASRFNDAGVTVLYQELCGVLRTRGWVAYRSPGRVRPVLRREGLAQDAAHPAIIPAQRSRHLAHAAAAVRQYRAAACHAAHEARAMQQLRASAQMVAAALAGSRAAGSGAAVGRPAGRSEARSASDAMAGAVDDSALGLAGLGGVSLGRVTSDQVGATRPAVLGLTGASAVALLEDLAAEREAALDPAVRALLAAWPAVQQAYSAATYPQAVGAAAQPVALHTQSLAGLAIPKVALPRFEDHGELLKWLLLENVPGVFPYTAGVFRFKREEESATRMFAGEGDPQATNRRFHLLSAGMPAKRLSTAFDSVTLYGQDPDRRPDIYGKIGNAGVSVATLEDMKQLYAGFDLCDPATSVSMTINGPAPTLLAMFLVTAFDQQCERCSTESGGPLTEVERAALWAQTLGQVRGTVQADILKEDQGQNTCIFSTEFSLKVMGDVQAYFVAHGVRHFYSVSISGYHIAEAGANPITGV